MALNFLNFNESKTDFLILWPSGARDALNMHLCFLEPYIRPAEKNLGVIMDSDFKLEKQINSNDKICLFPAETCI